MGWLEKGLKIVPLIISAINAVENLVRNKSGKDKQEAAIDTFDALIKAVEVGIDKDLLNEEEFQVLLRKFIDDYVAIQNFIKDKNKDKKNREDNEN